MKAKLLNKGLVTHPPQRCTGQKCCLHNPSDHVMKEWPVFVRLDKCALAERQCPHGIGHPDPDSLAYLKTLIPAEWFEGLAVHACDGCCRDK